MLDDLLIQAPFVISDAVFVHPQHRGFRLPYLPEGSLDEHQEQYVRHRVRIHGARSLSCRLDREGFQLMEAPVRMDFGDAEFVRTHFYEYCSDLVRAATGCMAAYTVQHQFRTGLTGAEPYSKSVHADISPCFEDFIDRDVPDARHFGLYNVWRGTEPGQVIEFWPLAVCDARTVLDADIVYGDALRTIGRTRLVNCQLIHNTNQRWCYFPRMTPDESLLFRHYDTRWEENAGMGACFHTAFRDPGTPDDVRPRRTIEARVLAIFSERDDARERRRARFRADMPVVRRDGSVSDWRFEEMVDWRRICVGSGSDRPRD